MKIMDKEQELKNMKLNDDASKKTGISDDALEQVSGGTDNPLDIYKEPYVPDLSDDPHLH